jgi:hypothetical protein
MYRIILIITFKVMFSRIPKIEALVIDLDLSLICNPKMIRILIFLVVMVFKLNKISRK